MYPPHHLGGYELVWQSATRALRAAGHEARVLTTDARPVPGDPSEEDADVHRELRWYWRDHGWPRLSPRQRLALEQHNVRVFDRHVRDLAPDAVVWWSMGGMSLSLIASVRCRGLPAVGFVHDDWMIYGPKVDAWLRGVRRLPAPLASTVGRVTRIPVDADLDGASRWLFVSETTRRRARELGGLSLRDSGIAHSGIDPSYVGRPLSTHPWRWRLLNVGRIDPRKGIDTAVDAVMALPREARLTVVGEGDERELAALRARAARLGVAERVRFVGARGREALRELYGASDVVVFPVRWEEPWGLVPLEAMALGRPVIATGRGGSGEYLRDGKNCLLFQADDPSALARALRRLAQDDALRARLQAGGLATAQLYTDAIFNKRVVAEVEAAAARYRA